MANRTCSVGDCDKPAMARGWCNTHYRRWQRYGTTERTSWGNVTACSVNGCRNTAAKRTWCAAHYRRWLTKGDVQADKPLRRVNRPTVDGRRQCNRCDEWKPVDDWARYECGDCSRSRQAEWYTKNPDRLHMYSQQRRAARLALPNEPINRAVVFERDDFTCQICLIPLDMNAERFDPLFPTVDHIIPLARGGHHIYSNVQAAHLRCNIIKGDKVAA